VINFLFVSAGEVKIFFSLLGSTEHSPGLSSAEAPTAGIHGVKKNALYNYALEQQGE